jgi:SAM-dependent methyltransferase
LLAARLAPHKAVLDLGCGTGYGAAILARAGAASVLGLDIDPSTVEWAQGANREKNLSFSVSSDLGAGLAAESFDLITCFEMIEHVTEPVQRATIASTARLLKKDGILLISTPNPIVTKMYGENPFHLRELTEEDFVALLREQFTHISLNHQFIHAGALIAPKSQIGSSSAQVESLRGADELSPAAAFIAVCSNRTLPALSVVNFVDNTDLIRSKIQSGHRFSRLQLEHLKVVEADANLHSQVADLNSQVVDLHSQVVNLHSQVVDLLSQKQQLGDLLTATEAQVRSLESSRLIQLERAIREEPWTLRKTKKIASILTSIAMQIRPRTLFSSWVRKKTDTGKASPRS